MAKQPSSKHKKTSPKVASKQPKSWLRKTVQKRQRRIQGFLSRRPHQSFRRTRRRDYVRSLELPNYVQFTNDTFRQLLAHKATYIKLVLFYALFSGILVGSASQANYQQLATTLNETSNAIFSGGWGEVGKASLLVAVGITGNFSTAPSEVQQVYGVLLFALLWLTTVWLLRTQIAGKNPTLRDGLYNSGAPIIGTLITILLLLLQLVPAILSIIFYNAAAAAGLLANGVVAMAFGLASVVLITLSCYFFISSFFAIIIVTLPGMYPWRAVQIAGDLVTGRRLRIAFRLLWVLVVVTLVWIAIMVPAFLLTNWFQSEFAFSASWPIIPLLLLISSSCNIVFLAAYSYLLYRKVVDDDASPAAGA